MTAEINTLDLTPYAGFSRAQALQLELIKLTVFNAFNGDRVVRDLLAQANLWRAALMNREHDPLIALRDIGGGDWNVDTLWLLPVPGKEEALRTLAKGWEADAIRWVGRGAAENLLGECSPAIRNNPRVILQLWWD